MKILQICGDYDKFHQNLISELELLKFECKIFYYTTRYKKNNKVVDEKVIFYNSKIKFLRSPLFFRTRINHIGKYFVNFYNTIFDFNLIHSHMWFSDGELAYLANKKWGTPYIVAIRNTDINSWYLWKLPWNRKRGFEILNNASKIIFLSSAYKDELLKRLPVEYRDNVIKKCEVIPNGVDNFWHINAQKYSKNTPNDIIKILTIGDIDNNKNQLKVLEALKIMINKGYKVKYTIVGKHKDKKIVQLLEKETFVEMLSYCPKDKLLEIYHESNIFVMPSIHETFGLVYVEALTQGLPIIYSKGQGFDGYFEQGEVGYGVNKNDAADIYEKIIKILDNYEEISQRAIKGSMEFNWHTISKRYNEIYKEIIGSC